MQSQRGRSEGVTTSSAGIVVRSSPWDRIPKILSSRMLSAHQTLRDGDPAAGQFGERPPEAVHAVRVVVDLFDHLKYEEPDIPARRSFLVTTVHKKCHTSHISFGGSFSRPRRWQRPNRIHLDWGSRTCPSPPSVA